MNTRPKQVPRPKPGSKQRPGQVPKAGPSSSRWILTLVGVAVLAAVVVAFISTRNKGSSSQPQNGQTVVTTAGGGSTVETAPVTLDGTPLPPLPTSGNDPAIGMPFPSVSGTEVLTGKPLTVPSAGRPKLVFYVAHWCPHCQREVPLLQSWIDQKGASIGVDLYAVSTAVDPSQNNYPPSAWLTKVHWSVPTLADSANNDAARAAGLSGYPFFVAVGKDGKVVKRFAGEHSIAEIESVVAALKA